MTTPLTPPPKKDPQKRTVSPTRPPEMRSRAALGLTAAAAEGRFQLQQCADCGAVQYPPRDACSSCLSPDLPWVDVTSLTGSDINLDLGQILEALEMTGYLRAFEAAAGEGRA